MPDVIKTGKKSELPAWSPQRPRMFFLHIPKTAGMSLRLFFSNQYPVSEILPANDWVQLLQVPTEYFEEYRLYQGHFSIGMLDLLPRDVKSVVFLRDPIQRTLSHLKHLRRDPNFHPAHKLAAGRSLADLVRDDRIMGLCCNTQTSQLSNDIPGLRILQGLKRDQESGIVLNADGYALPPDLGKAKDNLARFDYIGFVDTLQDDIRFLSMAFGLHPARELPRRNDDPQGDTTADELTEEILENIRNQNKFDIEFYEYAKKQRKVSWATCLENLVATKYDSIKAPIRFPLSGPIPGSNWYDYEYRDGPARWTGPSRETTLDLPLELGRDFEFTVSLTLKGLGDLKITTDSVELAYDRIASDDEEHTIVFWVTKDLVKEHGLTSIVFRTAELTGMSDSDLRVLSFLVRDLRISNVRPHMLSACIGGGRDSRHLSPAHAETDFDINLPEPESPAAANLPVTYNLPIDEDSGVALIGEAVGFFPDGWVRSTARFRCRALDGITSVSLHVWAPAAPEELNISMSGTAGQQHVTLPVDRGIVSILQFSVDTTGSEEFEIQLTSDQEQALSDADQRVGSYILQHIVFG